jgi:hypothetical protein
MNNRQRPVGRRLHALSSVVRFRSFVSGILFSCGIFSLAVLSGCAPHGARGAAAPVAIAESDGRGAMPFRLKVLDEYNDGAQLHIRGSVDSLVTWDPASVVVRLTGLNAGNQVGVTHRTLKELMGAAPATPLVEAGAAVPFTLDVPSSGITDYQIELLWGEEAHELLPQAGPEIVLKLSLRDLEIETLKGECPYDPCEVNFRLLGRLQNDGDGVIARAELGVGFVSVAELASSVHLGASVIPLQEETIPVNGLELKPGESQPFRVLLKQSIPEDESQQFKPVIRIVSFGGAQ